MSRFVARWVATDRAGRTFVLHDEAPPHVNDEQLRASGSTMRTPLYALHDGYWDREMNDICSVFERGARMNDSRPPVDRFAGLHPTKTEPSTFDHVSHVSCGYVGCGPMTPAEYKHGLEKTLEGLGLKLSSDGRVSRKRSKR